MEPEGLPFFAFAAFAFVGAVIAGLLLLALGFRKGSKPAKTFGALILVVSILPGIFVGSWLYHWITSP
jgi:hypothetical protein